MDELPEFPAPCSSLSGSRSRTAAWPSRGWAVTHSSPLGSSSSGRSTFHSTPLLFAPIPVAVTA
jgi:hypothetical protein